MSHLGIVKGSVHGGAAADCSVALCRLSAPDLDAPRCERLDPYARVRIRCVLDAGHEGRHLDAFGEDFADAEEANRG